MLIDTPVPARPRSKKSPECPIVVTWVEETVKTHPEYVVPTIKGVEFTTVIRGVIEKFLDLTADIQEMKFPQEKELMSIYEVYTQCIGNISEIYQFINKGGYDLQQQSHVLAMSLRAVETLDTLWTLMTEETRQLPSTSVPEGRAVFLSEYSGEILETKLVNGQHIPVFPDRPVRNPFKDATLEECGEPFGLVPNHVDYVLKGCIEKIKKKVSA